MQFSATEILGYLGSGQEGKIDFTNFEQEFVNHSARFLNAQIEACFACPIANLTPKADTRVIKETLLFSLFSSVEDVTPKSLCLTKKEHWLASASDQTDGVYNIHIDFSDHWPDFKIAKTIDIKIKPQKADNFNADEAKAMLREWVIKQVVSRCMAVRRVLIKNHDDASDLNSFCHKALNKRNLVDLLGVRAATIFMHDVQAKLIRMRASSHQHRQNNLDAKDVTFELDDTSKKLVMSFRSDRLIAEHNDDGLNINGKSHENLSGEPAIARAYLPMRLLSHDPERGPKTIRRKINAQMALDEVETDSFDSEANGVIRLVNYANPAIRHLPFSWVYVFIFSVTAEVLHTLTTTYVLQEQVAIKVAETYHGVTSVVDTLQKKIDAYRRELYGPERYPELKEVAHLKHRFEVKAIDKADKPRIEGHRRLLDTAFAAAQDFAFQAERALNRLPTYSIDYTEEFFTEVLFRALEMIPNMLINHNADPSSATYPKRVEFLGREPGSYPPPVMGPPSVLTSVLTNILDNSVKYKDRKHRLHISVDYMVDPDFVHFTFSDNGIGLKEHELDRVFRHGYRTPAAASVTKKGSGLGLGWCRDAIEAFGGQIRAEQNTPHGLKVIVKLKRK